MRFLKTILKLPYGFTDGKLVSIDMVESGLACNCFCPNCNSRLLAKKGERNIHHFSHYKNADCGWNGESEIHKIAKDVILKSKEIVLPRLYFDQKIGISIYEPIKIKVDNVRLEEQFGSIIPDLIIETKGRELLVEIKVSHGVDYDKYLKIKKLNLPTIEIDVNRIVRSLFTDKNYFLRSYLFEESLIDDCKNRYWIFNPEKERINSEVRKHAKKLVIKKLENNNDDFFGFKYVEICPLNKRQWKSGFKEGLSYAKIEDDCNACNYYMGQLNEVIEDKITSKIRSDLKKLYCIGDLASDNNRKIIEIISEVKRKLPKEDI